MLKVQKSFWKFIKILVFVLVVFVFVKQVLKFSVHDFSNLTLERLDLLFLALVLVFLNWGLELLKWLITVKLIVPKISLKVTIHSLLAGVSTGVVTPNRIGNFIGRMVYFKGKDKGLIIVGTLYGNLAQFIASILLGAIGLFYLKNNYISPDYSLFALVSSFILVVFSFVLYLFYPFVSIEFFKRNSFVNRFGNIIHHFQHFARKLLLPLLAMSMLRYLIFVVQFILVLLSFGVDFSFSLVLAVFLLYLLTTLTPSLIFGKLLVRETVALLILSAFVSNPVVIIVSSLSLWVMNLGVPSLLGLFFLVKAKTVR